MAELATPSGAAMFDGDAPTKKDNQRPEKPDDEAYKVELKKAEKAHEDAKTKFVSGHCCSGRAHARFSTVMRRQTASPLLTLLCRTLSETN